MVAVLLLLAITTAGAVLATTTWAAPTSRDAAAISVTADATTDRLTFVLRRGPALNVSRLSLAVRVDGRALRDQPPVPFFAARGFRGGPTGPFNAAADHVWTPGERASFRLATTNAPEIDPGDRIRVRFERGDETLATVETIAGS